VLLASCLLGIYKEKIFGDRELGDRGFPSRSVTSRQWSPRAYSLKAGAPASAAGKCKQPLVHSMGFIRLIETFCLRLRGMRRAIIVEGSQGSFSGQGAKSTARWPGAGRGWPR